MDIWKFNIGIDPSYLDSIRDGDFKFPMPGMGPARLARWQKILETADLLTGYQIDDLAFDCGGLLGHLPVAGLLGVQPVPYYFNPGPGCSAGGGTNGHRTEDCIEALLRLQWAGAVIPDALTLARFLHPKLSKQPFLTAAGLRVLWAAREDARIYKACALVFTTPAPCVGDPSRWPFDMVTGRRLADGRISIKMIDKHERSKTAGARIDVVAASPTAALLSEICQWCGDLSEAKRAELRAL